MFELPQNDTQQEIDPQQKKSVEVIENIPKDNTTKEEKNITLWYIEQQEERMQRLIYQLREKIEAGRYKYVIGDDASGRIPALIFYGFLKKVYMQKNLQAPSIYFIAGSGSERMALFQINKKRKLREYIGSYFDKNHVEGEALVVTDVIDTGTSLRPLVSVLKERGINFDIATLGSMGDPNSAKVLGHDFIYGEGGSSSSLLHKKQASGVEKKPSDVLSKRALLTEENEVRLARQDSDILVNRLYDWYTGKK